ncbi:hypothetical protein ACJX0J_039506, partial [Zea mays]
LTMPKTSKIYYSHKLASGLGMYVAENNLEYKDLYRDESWNQTDYKPIICANEMNTSIITIFITRSIVTTKINKLIQTKISPYKDKCAGFIIINPHIIVTLPLMFFVG